MFEQPEYTNLARQMNATILGKTITRGELGNSPHKFVWYNREPEEFGDLTAGKVVGETRVQGKWLLTSLEPGYMLLMGENGGKVFYHEAGNKLPKKYHLYIPFTDGSFLTATTQMWGGYELYVAGEEQERKYIKGMLYTPTQAEFTLEYFNNLVKTATDEKKRSVKSLLVQEATIPGLGNAIAQDIMFNARLHPKRNVAELNPAERETFYHAIVDTVKKAIDEGGRYDEYDLFGNKGGYERIMDKNGLKRPCPVCGGEVKKISYLGGAAYFCPTCQTL